MAYTIRIESSATTARVLEAIRSLDRLSETMMPTELREGGPLWVRSRTDGRRFKLRYGSRWESEPPVVIEGVVHEARGGESTISATVGYGRSRHAITVIGALGCAWASHGGFIPLWLGVGVVALTGVVAEWVHLSIRPGSKGADFLTQLLQEVVARAGGAA
jgi:hypothetical protein